MGSSQVLPAFSANRSLSLAPVFLMVRAPFRFADIVYNPIQPAVRRRPALFLPIVFPGTSLPGLNSMLWLPMPVMVSISPLSFFLSALK
jgi:hypothetical protein